MNLLDLLPSPPPSASSRKSLSAGEKTAILRAIHSHSWSTAREVYGWAWNHLGVRISYVTLWRYLNAAGLLAGDRLRGRRLSPKTK